MGAYEQLIPVANAATPGQVPVANGYGGSTWQAVDFDKFGTVTATINASDWSNGSATVNATGVTASNCVFCTPTTNSASLARDCGVYVNAQGDGTLTFTATTTPNATVTFDVVTIRT